MSQNNVHLVRNCGIFYSEPELGFKTAAPFMFGNRNGFFVKVYCIAGEKKKGTT